MCNISSSILGFKNYTLILWNHNIKEWVPKERIWMIHFTCYKYISLDTRRILVRKFTVIISQGIEVVLWTVKALLNTLRLAIFYPYSSAYLWSIFYMLCQTCHYLQHFLSRNLSSTSNIILTRCITIIPPTHRLWDHNFLFPALQQIESFFTFAHMNANVMLFMISGLLE